MKHLKQEYDNLAKTLSDRCPTNQKENTFQPIGSILISMITKEETNLCLGTSTSFGIITSSTCCQADEMYLLRLENFKETPTEVKSLWIEENICFINTTETFKFEFPILNDQPHKQEHCAIMMLDQTQGNFTEIELEIKINKCSEQRCLFDIDKNSFSNGTILNGTSIVCDQSSYFAIVTKSKSTQYTFKHYKKPV